MNNKLVTFNILCLIRFLHNLSLAKPPKVTGETPDKDLKKKKRQKADQQELLHLTEHDQANTV